MNKVVIIIFFSLGAVNPLYSQCIASFGLQTEVCSNERLQIITAPEEGETFWDFCSGDLEVTPVAQESSSNTLLYRARSLAILNDNDKWVGMSIDEPNNQLFRLNFNSDLSSEPVITNLANPGGLLSNAYDILLAKEQDNFYAFVLNLTNNKLIRLDFGLSLLNTPVAIDLGNPGGLLNGPKDIELIDDNGSYHLFIANSNASEIVHYSLGGSLTNNILDSNTLAVEGGSNLSGISFTKECSSYVGIISSYSNNKIFYLKYEGGLSNTPLLGELTLPVSISYPAKLVTALEGGKYYAFIQSAYPGNLYMLDFGSSILDLNFTAIDYGNFGIADYNYAFEMVRQGSDWRAFNIALSGGTAGYGRLFELSFPMPCTANQPISYEAEPANVHYQDSGLYKVTKEHRLNGILSVSSNDIIVNNKAAPYVQIETNEVVCIENSKAFVANSPLAMSYQWNFEKDTIYNEDSLGYIFNTSGHKTVQLIVQNEIGCSNYDEIDFQIYNKPIPSFDAAFISPCTNSEITFSNNSDINTIPDSLSTFLWNFNDEFYGQTNIDTTIVFNTSGQKSISLTASIPGCSNDTTAVLTIYEGAKADFAFENNCEEEEIQFNNLSQGTITGYEWSFGNDSTSFEEKPVLIFSSYGDYKVMLKVTNDQGCITQKVDTITIYDNPSADFAYGLSCEHLNTDFYDSTIVEGSNITQWLWNINNETFTNSTPSYTFQEQGDYLASLKVISEHGCVDSVMKTINVLPSPVAKFGYDESCINELVHLKDSSSFDQGSIKEWKWVIDNKTFSTPNVSYQFVKSGEHPVSLVITADNLCRNQSVDTITIYDKPSINLIPTLACEDQPLTVNSEVISEDPVLDYNWKINGTVIGSGQSVEYTPKNTTPLEVNLEVTTAGQCVFGDTINVSVNKTPTADFDVSTYYGGAPLEVTLTDYSSGGISKNWLLDDVPLLVEEGQPVIINELGMHNIKQVIENDKGCKDSFIQEVEVVEAKLDLILYKVRVVNDGGNHSFVLDILNNGSAQVRDVDVGISINNQVNFRETIFQFFNSGDSDTKMLSSTLESQPEFMCFTINAKNSNLQDINPDNNRLCINFDKVSHLLSPYPNPATTHLTVPVLLKENGDMQLTLINASGGLVYNTVVTGSKNELINYRLPVHNIPSGYYILKITSMDDEVTFPVIINR